jgi:hypothetical protein
VNISWTFGSEKNTENFGRAVIVKRRAIQILRKFKILLILVRGYVFRKRLSYHAVSVMALQYQQHCADTELNKLESMRSL